MVQAAQRPKQRSGNVAGNNLQALERPDGRPHQRPRLGRHEAFYWRSSFGCSSSGSFAMLAAIRRASSRVSTD